MMGRDHHNHIGGAWVPFDGPHLDVENPATEEQIARVPDATIQEVDAAVLAARNAFGGWSSTSAAERAALLDRLADELERRRESVTTTIVTDVGSPVRIATRIQTELPIAVLRSYATLLAEDGLEERIGNSLVVREPVGVVGAITPWNYPLHQVVCKIAPALAAGNTIVLKPSEVAPLVLTTLFEALAAAGFPAGVANLVHGRGPVVGEALASHPDVDMVSFTGSVTAGSRVGSIASAQIKKVALELGGKSANVVLDDADLTTAVKVGVANAFLNGGQTCTAWTRLLVPAELHDKAATLAGGFAESFVPGDPLHPTTRLGPLASRAQAERVRAMIETGIDEGADLITGGVERPHGLERGHYVLPTVLANVDSDSRVAQEEIFGPVLAVLPYQDEGEAVAIANNSPFGLHGAVWSANQDRAIAVARRMRTGSVDVNGGAYNMLAPFGGYKKSGVGRELGRHGLEEFQEVKSIQL